MSISAQLPWSLMLHDAHFAGLRGSNAATSFLKYELSLCVRTETIEHVQRCLHELSLCMRPTILTGVLTVCTIARIERCKEFI